jgi:hypothetical protein
MSELEKMQNLHQHSVKGEILTTEEQAALQNWYQTLDREEDLILNNSRPIPAAADLRQKLTETTGQVAKIGREIESLVAQNAELRNENQALKALLEARLAEKAA